MNHQREQAAACYKAFMLKNSTQSNLNLYDHLTQLLVKVMNERPQNVVDVIEDMSLDVKRGLLEDQQSTLRDVPLPPAAELSAEQQRGLLSRVAEEADQGEELVEATLPNVSEIGFYLEQAGVGLGRVEMQRLFLALKQLVDSKPLQRCRLWGKILGTESNYLVAECECRDGEEEEEALGDEDTPEDGEREVETRDDGDEENEGVEEIDPLPQPAYKPPPVVPKEHNRTGVNKCVYYVCKEPGLPWVKLPSVTPAQINVARQIRRFFTGRLDAPIVSYPPFPGNEANYLRAQIARISAGTQVSPLGFYYFGEEEGDEEDEAPRENYEENPEFDDIPVATMVGDLSSWVHHVQHILQQGRCTWVNLAAKPEDNTDEEGDEEEEKEEEPDELEPEVGPPLLTPLSEHAELLNTPPWTSRMSTTLTAQHAIAVLCSNLWPGAHTYACGKRFENIYIGWGVKFAGEEYTPSVPPKPQREYPSGKDITEELDPTLEQEQVRKVLLEEQRVLEEHEIEDIDGGEEEEEDDD